MTDNRHRGTPVYGIGMSLSSTKPRSRDVSQPRKTGDRLFDKT
jgi:hypothetical protein